MTLRDIEKYIEEKSGWIEKTMAKMNSCENTDEKPFTQEEMINLTKAAKEYIPTRVEYYAEIMGLDYNSIAIKTPKTRWGSCSSKRNLNFSCLLMLMPKEVLDSVVVHELCHLKEMNHSKRFYDEIYKVMPDYDKHDKWLKTNGYKYLRRLQK